MDAFCLWSVVPKSTEQHRRKIGQLKNKAYASDFFKALKTDICPTGMLRSRVSYLQERGPPMV